jgi:hypothetical protein
MVVPPLQQTTGSSRKQPTALSNKFKGLIEGDVSVMLGVIIGTALVLTWTMLLMR